MTDVDRPRPPAPVEGAGATEPDRTANTARCVTCRRPVYRLRSGGPLAVWQHVDGPQDHAAVVPPAETDAGKYATLRSALLDAAHNETGSPREQARRLLALVGEPLPDDPDRCPTCSSPGVRPLYPAPCRDGWHDRRTAREYARQGATLPYGDTSRPGKPPAEQAGVVLTVALALADALVDFGYVERADPPGVEVAQRFVEGVRERGFRLSPDVASGRVDLDAPVAITEAGRAVLAGYPAAEVEAWIRAKRDEYDRADRLTVDEWEALDDLLTDFREHVATGTPLDREAVCDTCQGRGCGECEPIDDDDPDDVNALIADARASAERRADPGRMPVYCPDCPVSTLPAPSLHAGPDRRVHTPADDEALSEVAASDSSPVEWINYIDGQRLADQVVRDVRRVYPSTAGMPDIARQAVTTILDQLERDGRLRIPDPTVDHLVPVPSVLVSLDMDGAKVRLTNDGTATVQATVGGQSVVLQQGDSVGLGVPTVDEAPTPAGLDPVTLSWSDVNECVSALNHAAGCTQNPPPVNPATRQRVLSAMGLPVSPLPEPSGGAPSAAGQRPAASPMPAGLAERRSLVVAHALMVAGRWPRSGAIIQAFDDQGWTIVPHSLAQRYAAIDAGRLAEQVAIRLPVLFERGVNTGTVPPGEFYSPLLATRTADLIGQALRAVLDVASDPAQLSDAVDDRWSYLVPLDEWLSLDNDGRSGVLDRARRVATDQCGPDVVRTWEAPQIEQAPGDDGLGVAVITWKINRRGETK